MSKPAHPPLVVILGPTAAGKTEIALRLAERLNGEIVSADSRLFYRGMNIGTAKPSPQDLRRVPHHLINVADPDETWSLAMFQEKARAAISEIHARGNLPLMVGGTGQYLRAVTEGWQAPAVEPDPRLRQILTDWGGQIGADALHARLAALDPHAAAQIDARNLRRTVRALEVILSSGRRFSQQRTRTPAPYRVLTLGLQRSRTELYARIDARIEAMIASGLVDEVRGLLAQGYSPDLPAFSAIGYREVIAYLQGRISQAQALLEMKRATRVFVRRQANWFKQDNADIQWFDASQDPTARMEAAIRGFLMGKTAEEGL
ncbi:MAG: tRNA (adenosine(37)-N6)-dimethylallyltransferase MiaA [Anaerolineales bacterium]|nr:tRNA (adenosine(37)-N6)-dimethylallyltransferase MiaA [Anaerolineales bacterium]